jgi:pimeloyl-ACP methyl ester carboxylesterase
MFEIKFVNRGFKDDLILIPGWATDYRIFTRLDLNYNYYLPLRFSPFDFSQDLSRYLKSNSIGKVSILGWSMGAFLAADFTVRNQDKIEQLILMGIKERYEAEALVEIKEKLKENKAAWLYKFYLDCFSRDDVEGLSWFRKELLKDYLKNQELPELLTGLDYLSKARLDVNSLRQIENLTIHHGSDDLIVPMKEAEEIKNKLPKAKLFRVEKKGHILWIKK